MYRLYAILAVFVLAMIAGCATQPGPDSPVNDRRDANSVTAVISRQAIAYLTVNDTVNPNDLPDLIGQSRTDHGTLKLACKQVEGITEFHTATGHDDLPKETARLDVNQAPGNHLLVRFIGDTWTMYKPYFLIVPTYRLNGDGNITEFDDRLLDLRDYKFQANGGMWLSNDEFAASEGMRFGDPLVCLSSAYAANQN